MDNHGETSNLRAFFRNVYTWLRSWPWLVFFFFFFWNLVGLPVLHIFVLDGFISRSSKILSSSARLYVDCLWTASFRFLCRFSIPISRLWLGHWGSVRVLSRSHSFWLSALGCCHVERWTSGCVQVWFYAMEPVFLFRSIPYWAQITVFLIAASFLMPMTKKNHQNALS